MGKYARGLACALLALAQAQASLGQEVRLEVQGGPRLTVQAVAQQQQWLAHSGKIWAIVVVDGKLLIQEVQIVLGQSPSPGPQPGPEPKPDPKPDPKPEPQPPKPTKWQIAFFVESNLLDNLAPDQKALLAALLVRRDLEAKGHRLVGVFDPDAAGTATDPALRPWVEAAKGKAPCVAIAPMDGGTIRVFPLPASIAELWKLLENPPAIPSPQNPPGQAGCQEGRCIR